MEAKKLIFGSSSKRLAGTFGQYPSGGGEIGAAGSFAPRKVGKEGFGIECIPELDSASAMGMGSVFFSAGLYRLMKRFDYVA